MALLVSHYKFEVLVFASRHKYRPNPNAHLFKLHVTFSMKLQAATLYAQAS